MEAIDGGVKRHVMSILGSVDRGRFEVEVAGPTLRRETGEGSTFVTDVTALGVRFNPIEMRRAVSPARDLAALTRLCLLIRRRRYDVVHGHSSKAGFLARLAGWLTRTPTVYTPNALYFLRLPRGWRRALYLTLERLARSFTTRFVAVSESERQVALRAKLVPDTKIVVIPNGVPQDAFNRPAHARAHVRAELGIPLDAFVIGTAARLTAQKDPQCLVRAIGEVNARAKRSVHLVWAGDGELADDVHRLVTELALESCCRLLGFRSDVRSVMCAFDVFALTSRYEGLPYAVLEAMALGLPVVATDVVGTRDVVVNGVTGYLVTPNGAEAVAHAILSLVSNENLRLEMGQQARRAVADRFTLTAMARRLEQLYTDVAARGVTSPTDRPSPRRQTVAR